jgi:hypothetical protein
MGVLRSVQSNKNWYVSLELLMTGSKEKYPIVAHSIKLYLSLAIN